MKIAYILPSLINKGPIIVVRNLVRHLIDKVSLIDVYYFDELDAMDFDCCVYRIRMDESIDFDKYDIVHCHGFRPDRYVTKWRNSIKSAKILTTIHQDTLADFAFQYNYLISLPITLYWFALQRKFDGIISVSNQIRNKYNFLLKKKITTIFNGTYIDFENKDTSPDYLSAIIRLRERFRILGTYAFITNRKGLSQVIKILPQMDDYAFVIIGDGPEVDNLKHLSEKMKVSDRVLFLPYISEPYNYLSYFDVYMMTSYSEGLSLAMIEAALAEKSIVCSNLPTFQEVFSNEEVSFFETNNSESLVNAIKDAYRKKTTKGQLANRKALSQFTSYKMAENHLEYYKKMAYLS